MRLLRPAQTDWSSQGREPVRSATRNATQSKMPYSTVFRGNHTRTGEGRVAPFPSLENASNHALAVPLRIAGEDLAPSKHVFS